MSAELNSSIDDLTVTGGEEDIVTPWTVESKNDSGIDCDKLIRK